MSKFKQGDSAPFHPSHAGNNYCVVCNRKVGESPLWLGVVNGGEVWDYRLGEPDLNDSGYMGHYPVGSECAKKFEEGVLIEGV